MRRKTLANAAVMARPRQVFVRAMANGLLNPKALIFFLTFLPAFVNPAHQNVAMQLWALGLWLTAVALLFHAALGFIGAHLRRAAAQASVGHAALQWLHAAVLAGLAAWALINGGLVHWGFADMPGVSLMLGFLGALAIVTIGALLAQAKWPDALRFCGEHSIVIYLAFFLPMAATRTLLLKTGFIADIGLQALLVTIAGVFGALLIWWLTRVTGYGSFLFTRPDAFWIAPRKAAQLQAAE